MISDQRIDFIRSVIEDSDSDASNSSGSEDNEDKSQMLSERGKSGGKASAKSRGNKLSLHKRRSSQNTSQIREELESDDDGDNEDTLAYKFSDEETFYCDDADDLPDASPPKSPPRARRSNSIFQD